MPVIDVHTHMLGRQWFALPRRPFSPRPRFRSGVTRESKAAWKARRPLWIAGSSPATTIYLSDC